MPATTVAVPAVSAPAAVVAVATSSVAPSTKPDDLKRIRAIDAVLETALNRHGIRRFSEIAAWKTDDVARISKELGFKGRIEQENWIEQAQILTRGEETFFSRRLARGEMPSARPVGDEGERKAPAAAPVATAPAPMPSRSGVEAAAAAAAAMAAAAAASRAPQTAASAVVAAPVAARAPAEATPPQVSDRAAFAGARPAATASPAAAAAPAPVAPPIAVARPVAPVAAAPVATAPAAATTAVASAAAAIAAAAARASPAASATPVPAAQVAASSVPAAPSATTGMKAAIGTGRDNLQRIGGINAEVEKLLNVQGVTRYAQIAHWSKPDTERFDRLLGYQGRIARENWIEQAQILGKGGDTAYSREFDRRTAENEARTTEAPRPTRLADAIRTKESERPKSNDISSLRSVRSDAFRPAEQARQDAPMPSSGAARSVRSTVPDDLKRIRGIGVLIEKKLNSMGVTGYDQIANWSAGDIERVSQVLDFKGRIERENWVEQARILAAGGQTEFSRRADRGDIDIGRG